MKRIDNESLYGNHFGRLTVIDVAYKKNNKTYFNCLCSCGKLTVVCKYDLIENHTRSCGCIVKEKLKENRLKHGAYQTRLYRVWQSMKNRCLAKNSKRYKDYGGRGITICEEWVNDFENFKKWALENGYSDELTIDRIDNDGNYCPENCRWATKFEQSHNRRSNHYLTYNGKTQCILDWERELGISNKLICFRLKKGMPIEKVLSNKDFRLKENRN